QNITRKKTSFFRNLFSISDLIHFLRWNQHLRHIITHFKATNLKFDLILYFLLLTADSTNNVPLFINFSHPHRLKSEHIIESSKYPFPKEIRVDSENEIHQPNCQCNNN